jgi:hypothetical protein
MTYAKMERVNTMIRLHNYGYCLLLFVLIVRASLAQPRTNLDVLAAHNITPSASGMISFLNSGWATVPSPDTMPEFPTEKTQLFILTMEELGKARESGAVDVLLNIAQGKLSDGVEQIIQNDLAKLPPEQQASQRQFMLTLLRYNAVNALGLIGDARTLPVVEQLATEETNARLKCRYILAIACLGGIPDMDFLVAQIGRANQTESVTAAQVFYLVTGTSYRLVPTTPVKARTLAAYRYETWWRQNRGTFTVNPKAVIRRRLTPPVEAKKPLTSVRNLLDAASHILDIDGQYQSYEARQQLDTLGPSMLPDLEKIVKDEMEDLRIRRLAIFHYVKLQGKKAKKILKKLRKDENPEISQLARSLLLDLQ